MVPVVTWRIPRMSSMRVVLPAPFGPAKATNSRAETEKLTASKSGRLPNA